jgi:1-deoxy-D-xylulose-5-phosphate synthase
MISVPGMAVTAPKDGAEMLALLRLAVDHLDGPFSIRWPRDSVPRPVPHISEVPEVSFGSWETLRDGKDVAILAVGTMVLEAEKAAEALASEGIEARVVNCRFMKPYDGAMLREILTEHDRIITVEEGAVVNGFGAFLARELEEIPEAEGVRLRSMGIPDRFVAHGSREVLLREIDLDAQGITDRVRLLLGAPRRETRSRESRAAARETA